MGLATFLCFPFQTFSFPTVAIWDCSFCDLLFFLPFFSAPWVLLASSAGLDCRLALYFSLGLFPPPLTHPRFLLPPPNLSTPAAPGPLEEQFARVQGIPFLRIGRATGSTWDYALFFVCKSKADVYCFPKVFLLVVFPSLFPGSFHENWSLPLVRRLAPRKFIFGQAKALSPLPRVWLASPPCAPSPSGIPGGVPPPRNRCEAFPSVGLAQLFSCSPEKARSYGNSHFARPEELSNGELLLRGEIPLLDIFTKVVRCGC